MTKPITPSEIGDYVAKSFPPEVFDAFNELIAANFTGYSATVYQKDAILAIMSKLDIERSDIFKKGYLNIEEAYRAAGWKVEYDKPAYNESYDANFTFRKK